MKILICFLVSYLITFLLTPNFRKYFSDRKIFDKPNFRSQRSIPIVRTGGISIFISFIFTFILSWYFGLIKLIDPVQFGFILPVLIFASLFFLIGLIDDLYYLSPFLRLVLQFSAASILWIFNLKINFINLLWFNNIELPILLSYFLTIFWIVGITNAINWLDGLDGLTAGVIFIYLIGLAIASITYEQSNIAIASTIISGSCLAFLKYNNYPANIIMGDGGSNFLGFMISILSLYAFKSLNGPINLNFSLGILILPIYDMIFVISKRISSNKSPFFPDRSHLHHRLLKSGLSEKKVVWFIYLLAFINTLVVVINL